MTYLKLLCSARPTPLHHVHIVLGWPRSCRATSITAPATSCDTTPTASSTSWTEPETLSDGRYRHVCHVRLSCYPCQIVSRHISDRSATHFRLSRDPFQIVLWPISDRLVAHIGSSLFIRFAQCSLPDPLFLQGRTTWNWSSAVQRQQNVYRHLYHLRSTCDPC